MKARPSKFLVFLFSLCPGVGHMYLRAMNRGLQFMLLFFGSIFLLDLIPFGVFPFWIPIIWFYAMFDSLQLAEEEEISDRLLVEWGKLKISWLGTGLIVLGLLFFADNVLPRLFSHYLNVYSWYTLRSAFMAMILMGSGLILLLGRKVRIRD